MVKEFLTEMFKTILFLNNVLCILLLENIYAKSVLRNSQSKEDTVQKDSLRDLSSNEGYNLLSNPSDKTDSPSGENIASLETLNKKIAAPVFLILNENETNVPPYLDHKPWPLGIVPYFLDHGSYDGIVAKRVRVAMNFIEEASCVQFRPLIEPASDVTWIHITNPYHVRDCIHENSTDFRSGTEKVMVLGLDCMQTRDILHSLMHALGFKDEVTHPQRDKFVRIKWENIHQRYLSLFHINYDFPTKTTEYDPTSIMQFHDRAFTKNGQATIESLIPGLLINPSNELSPLDKMKLRMQFGHKCNRRKVDNLVDKCKYALQSASGNEGDDYIDNGDENGDYDPDDADPNDESAEMSASNENKHLDAKNYVQDVDGEGDNEDGIDNASGTNFQMDLNTNDYKQGDAYDVIGETDIKPYKDENYIDRYEGDENNEDLSAQGVYRKTASRKQESKHKENATTVKNKQKLN